MYTMKKNKSIFLSIIITLFVIIGVMVLVGVLSNNSSRAATTWECPTHGSEDLIYYQYNGNIHTVYCRYEVSEGYSCTEQESEAHTEGTHASNGACTLCGYQVGETHTVELTDYRTSGSGGSHIQVYTCTASGCTYSQDGATEGCSGGTHANGGVCAKCDSKYQTHTLELTDYRSSGSGGSHILVYTCTFSSCTYSQDGASEGCSYTNGTCSKCGATQSCSHTKNSGTVITAATCGTAGVMSYSCSLCGTSMGTEAIPATGNHTKNSGTVTKAATCGTAGVKSYSCSVCGTSMGTETIPATGNHTKNSGTVTTAATCGTAGVKSYSCSVCGASMGTEAIPATGNHTKDGGTVTTPATCTTEGVMTYYCEDCGKNMETEAIPATGEHTSNGGIVHAPATCSTAGGIGYACIDCGTSLGVERIPPTGNHTKDGGTVTIAATCSTAGEISYSCSDCGTSMVSEVIPATGIHMWKSATCTTPKTCSDCGATQGQALGHTGGTHANNGVCQTCSTRYQIHSKSTEIKAYETTNAKHTPIYKCTYAGCESTYKGTEENHTVKTWTDKGNGTHSGSCTACSGEMTVTHTYTNGKCNDCGVAEPVEECEHNYKIEKDANGHWEICTKCNTIKEGSLVEHTVEIWIDNENGTHSGNCKVCQYTLTRTHEFENGICADCELQEGCEHNYEMKSDNTHHWEACNKCEMIKENSKVNHTVTTAINNKNGTHTGTCTVCNYAVTESHSNGTSGDCETCDYVGDDNGNNNDDNNNNNGDDNNNNNDDENNNQNDNNNNGNDNSSEDGTQADGKIPQTGINSVIAISSIAGLAILGINAIIRLRRYKDVK